MGGALRPPPPPRNAAGKLPHPQHLPAEDAPSPLSPRRPGVRTYAEEQVANFNCNAACAVRITHHFLRKMQARKLRGCLVYTSSPAGFMPCPFSVMYGATKAFLTAFATSLAPEVCVGGGRRGLGWGAPAALRRCGAHSSLCVRGEGGGTVPSTVCVEGGGEQGCGPCAVSARAVAMLLVPVHDEHARPCVVLALGRLQVTASTCVLCTRPP